jgi:hypothetical protein
MHVPAILTPTATSAVQPASARPNPMSPASSSPVGAAPPQQTIAQSPPVGGVTQANLPPNPQTQKMAALKRAELYSILYKFGAAPQKKKAKTSKPTVGGDVARGAAIGGAAGAVPGAAAGLYGASQLANEVPVKLPDWVDKTMVEANTVGPNGMLQTGEHSLEDLQRMNAIAKGQQGMVPRLRAVIKQHGYGRILKTMALPTLGMAGLGAAGGAALGYGYNALRNRNKQNA